MAAGGIIMAGIRAGKAGFTLSRAIIPYPIITIADGWAVIGVMAIGFLHIESVGIKKPESVCKNLSW